jgi:hypothetical protein
MGYVPNEPVVILTASEARILWQAARLNELRLRHRTGDSRLYDLLRKFYRVGLLELRPAGSGNEPRQDAAKKERAFWTTQRLGKAARRATRTITDDINLGALPAERMGHGWMIADRDAQTYIAAHTKN